MKVLRVRFYNESAIRHELKYDIEKENLKYKVIKSMMNEVHDMIIKSKLIMFDIREGDKYKKDINDGFKELRQKLKEF